VDVFLLAELDKVILLEKRVGFDLVDSLAVQMAFT
jgi:hypothetical protein